MIQINLIPDVKREYLAARKLHSMVVTGSLLASAAAIGIVVLLAVNVFGVQALRNLQADNSIKDEHKELVAKEGLVSAVTVHDQLKQLSELQGSSKVNSRVFDMLSAIVPNSAPTVAISKTTVDTDENTVQLEAQSPDGYAALEKLKKTIAATNLRYLEGDEAAEVPLASDIVDSERSFGEDAQGTTVLRFTVSFTYDEALFSNQVRDLRVEGPERANVTDSFTSVPDTLFTSRAGEEEEE
jgi:Tfp pilus assembly protein PilN